MDLASNIIAEIDKSSHRNIVTDIATFLFPLAVLLTSIPVYSIVVRYNLERSGLCERRMATLLSTFLPWIIVLLFQSGVCQKQKNQISSIEIIEQGEKGLDTIILKPTTVPSKTPPPTLVPPSSPMLSADTTRLSSGDFKNLVEKATNKINGTSSSSFNDDDNFTSS
ncbi:hypothetical protein C1645_824762 [Glomus cerebriforme]|uniref:Uncharacterized protein n=1 Tax=Glomus cerebriforme TaxID=658196 RepID=A0A397SUX1_9GLOM|nr:hypothetical protein C1645_824762 [Glomus cerebriforme]